MYKFSHTRILFKWLIFLQLSQVRPVCTRLSQPAKVYVLELLKMDILQSQNLIIMKNAITNIYI